MKQIAMAVILMVSLVQGATIRVPQDQGTIQAGINAAVDGDTVLVGPGVWDQQVSISAKSLVLISSAGAANTVIQTQDTALIVSDAIGDVELVGFRIGPCDQGVYILDCNSVGINNCVFEQVTHIDIRAVGSTVEIVGNRFNRNQVSSPSVFVHGGTQVVLKRNVFANGIPQPCVYATESGTSCILENNTFFQCWTGVAFQDDASGRVANNIFFGLGNYAIHSGNCTPLFTSDYNCLFGNTTDFDHCAVPGTDNIFVEPMFISEDGSDLNLSASSPCIDAGDPNPIYNDPDGSRNDMGAFSFYQQDSVLFVPEDFPTIQSAIDALTTARTISIGSGTYYENLDSRGKWFNLVGRAGADSTIVIPSDSSICLLHYQFTIETWDYSTPGDTLRIEGVEFRGCKSDTTIKIGWPEFGYPTSILFSGCRFIENGIDSSSILICNANDNPTSIVSCQFESNIGTCVGDANSNSEFHLDNSLFIQNIGNPLITTNDQYVEVDSNYFSQNIGTILELECGDSYVRYNSFHKNLSPTLYSGNTDFIDKVFSSNFLDSNETSQDIVHLSLDMHGESFRFLNNVIVDNEIGGSIFVQPGEGLQFTGNLIRNNYFGTTSGVLNGWHDCIKYFVINNIIAENYNTVGLSLTKGAGPYCFFYVHMNDSWNNELGNFGGDVDSTLNISADPMFCNADNGNYTLAAESPAVGMGPFGVGCSATPVIDSATILSEAPLNVVNDHPKVSWHSVNQFGLPQSLFEIAVGTDNDWQFSEMWNPAPFASADTFVVYNGAPLVDGETYWLRLRVNNSLAWSEWTELTFRMNSVPGVPELRLPVDLAIVNTEHPTLMVRNPSDAEDDSLLITFELSGDNFATSFFPIEVKAGSDSLTSFWVNFPLNEDLQFWWRVKASDYYEESPYSPVRSFWINSVNSAPTAFSLMSPANRSSPALPINVPEFTWQNSMDIDPGDSVEFTLQLAIDPSFSFMSQITGLTSPNYLPATPLEWGRRYWWRVKAEDQATGLRWSNETFDFKIMALGDADGSGTVTISDVVFLINYIFGGGPAPNPIESGDADCSGAVTISDVVYLINYIFAGTAAPCEG